MGLGLGLPCVNECDGLRAQLLQQGAHLLAEQGSLCLREVAVLEELR